MSGLSLPLFSLLNRTSASGDFGKSATDFVDLLADAGLTKWLTLPLAPGRVDRRLHLVRTLLYGHIPNLDQEKLAIICEPLQLSQNAPWFDKCPYLPISAFAVSPFYIDSTALGLDDANAISTCLTSSLYSEPQTVERSLCPWISGWLAKYEKLATAFQSKQQILCTDRQVLSNMRALALFESRCKAQRAADAVEALRFRVKGKPPHKEELLCVADGAESTKKIDNAENEALGNSLEVNDASDRASSASLDTGGDDLLTGECTATAAKEEPHLIEVDKECPLPEAITTWPDWLKSFWTFISCEENRHWVLDYAAFESCLDKEAMSERSASDIGEGGFVEDWQKWACSRVQAQDRVLYLWDNSEPLFLRLGGDFCISYEFQRSFLFHLYCQWIATTQLQKLTLYALSKKVHICGDCPIYLPLQSCDCWAYPQVFSLDTASNQPTHVSGLPPDFWSTLGQLWNTPLYNWDANGCSAERWWSQRLTHALQLTSEMRIDHFRAFADFWAVEKGWAEAHHNGLKGAWKRGPGAEFFTRFFRAHPEINPQQIIVEDLCEPTPAFVEMRRAVPFARMGVLQFHLEHLASHPEDEHPDSWLVGTGTGPLVIFSGTHDNPTLREWIETSASDAAKRLLSAHLGKVPMRSAMLPRFLIAWMTKQVRKACKGQNVTIYVPVQDILCLGVDGRLNRPGAFEPTMWSWRLNENQMGELQGLVKWMRSHLSALNV